MNKDLGKVLLAKTKTIAKSWIEAIREDADIESSKNLAYKSVRDSIPLVIEALATLLSQSIEDRTQKLESKSLDHGVVRARQNYDIAEIVREYSLLRKVIFAVLKPELLDSSPDQILQTIELLDSVIDRVISLSLDSYVATRLKELDRLRGQLLLTNQELTRLVESQREDISHLAHELKTPLNSIMGFSAILLQQQQLTKDSETALSLQCTEKVISNSKQLLRLINDVLEISRHEAGKTSLNLEPIDVRSLITLVVEALEPSAKQKNLELIIDYDRAPQSILNDPLKLRQIITNLVSNAIRYTESGLVKITCLTLGDRQWSIAIADTGIGIEPEIKAQIFEPYYRVGATKDYSPDSTGLGLAIVERLVKLLQGEINIVSEPQRGSIFTVTFPREITSSQAG